MRLRNEYIPVIVASGIAMQFGANGCGRTSVSGRLAGIPILELTDAAQALAGQLIGQGLVPKTGVEDSLHIALATVHGMDFLLTWNFRHINTWKRFEKYAKPMPRSSATNLRRSAAT
jgi:hypothetical protein